MGKPRKKLEVDEETFFLAVQLGCGPPKREYFHYTHHDVNGFTFVGITAWIKFTPEGKKFERIVSSYGEAKLRAARWYIKYSHWWRKQHNLEPFRWKNGTPVGGNE